MVAVSLIKIGITLVGLFVSMGLLIFGLLKKDKGKLKQAGLIFAGTWVALILISVIEFLIARK